MAEKVDQVDKAIQIIRDQLQVLRNAGAICQEQYASINAQLPAPGGLSSKYVDARFGCADSIVSPELPQTIAQHAQDPNHPANPNHHKHSEWAKRLATNFGNAVVFGGGATLGADMVNGVIHAL